MTSHAPTIDLSHDQPPLPNQHFSSWLRSQTALFISQIVAILGVISFLASLVYYVLHLKETSEFLQHAANVRLIVDYAHIVFMAVFSLALIHFLDDNERGSYRVGLVYKQAFGKYDGRYEQDLEESKRQLKKFKRRFLCFWIGMLCLYISFAGQHSYDLSTPKPGGDPDRAAEMPVSVTVKDSHGKETHYEATSNHGVAEASKQTRTDGEGDDSNKEPQPLTESSVRKKFIFEFFVFLFNNFTLLAAYWCFIVMHVPPGEKKKARWHWIASTLVVGALTALFPVPLFINAIGSESRNWDNYVAVFDALSGVINALVLALLIARLDSKLIGLPSWLISILYSYAAVQPLFIVFELSQSDVLKQISVFVLVFVFLSKVYFFFIIVYALQTGKMLNYLFCFHVLRRQAKKAAESQKKHVPKAGRRKPLRLYLPELLKTLVKPRAYVSGFLSGDGPLLISMGLGLLSILYFFTSLIYSQLVPGTASTGGDYGHGSNLGSLILMPPDSARRFIDYAQIGVVLGMILILWLVLKENDYEEDEVAGRAKLIFGRPLEHRYPTEDGKEQLRKFKLYFLWFWVVTLVLYFVFLLKDLGVSFCLTGTSSVALTSETLGLTPVCAEFKPHSVSWMFKILLYPFLEFFFATLNILFIFRCFVVLHSPAFDKPTNHGPGKVPRQHLFDKRAGIRQRLMLNYSAFILPVLIAIFPLLLFMLGGPNLSEESMHGYATVFDGMTGTLSAIALALLIARMDSKLFGLPPWSMSIWILFAYASIQPLFVAFALNDVILNMVRGAVLVTALGLKICFFLIIAHSLQSRKAINYLICFPFLRDRVESIFENQFEIRLARVKDELFTIQILKKNELHYSTAEKFKTRKECDKFVRDLLERMKKTAAYGSPQDTSGTYWVEVRSDKKDAKTSPEEHVLLCESIPLRSEEEAWDLIDESLDKIPYCKYNRV